MVAPQSDDASRESAVSDRKREANRRNAQFSTGPKTEAGKEKSSRNAIKLGLFSRHVLLPGEDEAELLALRDGIRARWKPADAMEEIYVERIVAASWRLQRALAHEAYCYVAWQNIHRQYGPEHMTPRNESCPVEDLVQVQKHIASLERSIDKAVAELGKLQKARREAQEDEDQNCENEPTALVAPANCENEPTESEAMSNRENEPTADAPAATVGPGGRYQSGDAGSSIAAAIDAALPRDFEVGSSS